MNENNDAVRDVRSHYATLSKLRTLALAINGQAVIGEVGLVHKAASPEAARDLCRAVHEAWSECSAAINSEVDRPSAPSLTEDQLRKAMRQAFSLGQIYWQQADSEYVSQNKKSDATAQKFHQLTDDTCAILAPAPKPTAIEARIQSQRESA